MPRRTCPSPFIRHFGILRALWDLCRFISVPRLRIPRLSCQPEFPPARAAVQLFSRLFSRNPTPRKCRSAECTRMDGFVAAWVRRLKLKPEEDSCYLTTFYGASRVFLYVTKPAPGCARAVPFPAPSFTPFTGVTVRSRTIFC